MLRAEFQRDAGSSTHAVGENLTWYRAVALAERLSAYGPRRASSPPQASERTETSDDDRLRYCLSSWKSQKPFDDPQFLRQRLNLHHLTEQDLSNLIAESPASIRRRLAAVPAWMAAIESALSVRPTYEFQRLLTNRMKGKPTTGFLDVAAPFIGPALRQLESGAARLSRQCETYPFDPDAVCAIFFPHLAKSLLRIVSRTMVLELNVARLTGTLAGTTAEHRFASFIAQLHSPERLRSLFEEYPVLARLIAEATARWVAVSLEFLERVATDFASLETAFAGHGALGPLVGASGGLADPHAGGRSVVIAEFGSGTRVVYKPKSLAVDGHFQDLLRWLSAEGFAPGFRTLTLLDRGSYGWAEFATPASCQTRNEVSRFYERAGGLLALLYVTEGTDLHAGNLIASGEHPVLVDLEALFHPHRSQPTTPDGASADAVASRLMRSSVLRIGLLPERQWGNSEHDGVDVSGLGAPEGQVTPHGVADWEAVGTDTMHLVRRRKAIEADRNRPTLNGQRVDVLDFHADLTRGFRSAYTILADRRERLLLPNGPLRRFSRDSVSVFLRSSRTYRKLLRESYHPDVLRDALDRDRLFDLLWVEVPDNPALTWVICSEHRDLWSGDIPSFSAHPDSRALRFGDGHSIADFFPEPSLSSVERIVGRLSEEDGARQAWFIDASLASLPGALDRGSSYIARQPTAPADPTRLLDGAVAVGQRLGELAVRSGSRASWIGLDRDDRRHWSIARAGLDLDAGIPGVALFLAYLGAVTGREAPSALAREALASIQEQIEERANSLTGVGGFDGLGGIIYVLSHLATLWARADLASTACALTVRLPDLIDEDDDFDIFAGAAGCILGLRSLHRCLPSDRVMAAAIQCGDHIIRSSLRTPVGISWPGMSDGPKRRAGLAYGATGVAFALSELHSWTGCARFRDAAAEALEGERRRSSDEGPHAESRWSAWSPDRSTLALAHLCGADSSMTLPGAGAEVDALAALIRDRGFGSNHSLCHGDLGSLELLGRAAVALGDEGMAREAEQAAALVLVDIEHDGWRCGTPLGVETPGLLAGLAGIGYGLLRTARPDLVPSVLTLEPPLSYWRTHGG